MKRNFPRTSGISGTRRRVLVGGSLLGASQVIRFGTRAAYIVLLARYLGPEAFGLFNYGVAWYLAFLSLTYLGFDLIISREAWQDDVRSKELLAATLRILLLVTAIAALLSLGLAVFTERGEPAFILVLFSLALVGRAVAVWVSFVLIAQNRSGRVLLLEGSCRVGEVLIGSAALILGADLMGVVAIHAGFWWVQTVFGLRQIKIADLLRTPMGLRDGLILLGAKPFILGLAGIFQVWIAQGPIILFHLLGGDDASLGAIAVAFQIFGVIAGVFSVATRALLPDLSRNVRGGGVADETVLRLLGPGILLSTAVLAAGAVIFAFPLITALFGSRYTDISAFVPVAVAASGAYMIAVCGHQILSAHLKDGAIVLGTFGGAMAATIVMVVMWQHGPQFAPFASLSAGVLVWMLIIVASLRSVTRFSVIRVFLGPFLAGGMGVLAAAFLEASGPVVAAVGSLLAIAVSAAMMHLWKGSPAD